MIRQQLLALLLCLIALPLAAMKVTESITVTNDKPNFSINSKQSQFTIQLKSNPSTGYSWFLREYDDSVLMPTKHEFIAAKNNLIGASGYENFTFKVKSSAFVIPQISALRFVYMRPWIGMENASQSLFHVAIVK